jgi:hypothetical protein
VKLQPSCNPKLILQPLSRIREYRCPCGWRRRWQTVLRAYAGNSPAALDAFERWLRREVDAIQTVVGGAAWADFTSSAGWMTSRGRFP